MFAAPTIVSDLSSFNENLEIAKSSIFKEKKGGMNVNKLVILCKATVQGCNLIKSASRRRGGKLLRHQADTSEAS